MRTTQHQHRSVSITTLVLVLLLGNPVSAAFQQGNSHVAHTSALKTATSTSTSNSKMRVLDSFFAPSMTRHQHQSSREKQTTSTSLYLIDPTSIGATIIALASAAAAWQEYRTDKFQAYREVTGRLSLFEDDKDTKATATVVEDKTAEQTPTPAPKKSFVSKLNPRRSKKKEASSPAPTPEPVNVSKSVTTTAPAPAPAAPKPLTLEVGNTIEKNREMNELGEKRRKEDEEKSAAAKKEKEKKDEAAKAAQAAATTTTTKKQGFLRKTWRVVKKIIAPWRKWENIS